MRSHLALAVVAASQCGTMPVRLFRNPRPFRRRLRAGPSSWSRRPPRFFTPQLSWPRPDGSVYIGSDPMDMPGPPTVPIDRVIRLKEGRSTRLRREPVERHGAGVDRRDALRRPCSVSFGVPRH